MWNLIRDLGNGEKLVSCSECGYQTVVDELPNECPNCGEVMEGMARKSIDLKQSSLDVKDYEPEVYEYERDTPVYKLWYFWVIAVMVAIILLLGARYAREQINTEKPEGGEGTGEISFEVPTGWSKVDDSTYTGPDETSSIAVITCNVSRLDNIDDLGRLVADLSDMEDVEEKEINGIDGRYMSWVTRKVVDDEEVFTDYARYTFIYKNTLYILTFKTTDGNLESFDSFISSVQEK